MKPSKIPLPKIGERDRGLKTEYVVTVDMAKELCMLQRNAKGKEARLYFIAMERKAKELAGAVPKSLPEALRMAAALAEKAERQEAKLRELAPKVAFFDNMADASGCHTVAQFAQMLGTGQNRFFAWLYKNEIVIKKERRPYQKYEDAGYFKVIETQWAHPHTGEMQISHKVLITPKGAIWLEERWRKQEAA